ncbi:hypothetical protein PFISCL1PPCAC_13834, partial [Pristionchus fissidentatus]
GNVTKVKVPARCAAAPALQHRQEEEETKARSYFSPHASVSSSKSSSHSHRSEEQHPNWARSNSLRSQQQYNAAGIVALPSNFAKGGSVSGRRVEKRHSVKTMSMGMRGRQEDKTTKDRRRSNSSVRDVVPAFFNRITNAVRRKSAERKSPGRLTSPPSRHANG